MKKLVIKDIARLAGVSRSTVSKAINNYKDIPEETREKIRKIITENHYRPSRQAQMLRKGGNDTIAFMSGRISAHFTAEILSAIERRTFALNKYVHNIIPYSTNYDRAFMNEIFSKILDGREASAVVALAMNPDSSVLEKYREAGIPVVLIENYMKNAHSVNTDNRLGGFMAADYLVGKGRKKIGLICGGLKQGSPAGYSYAAIERKAGFEEAMEKHGIDFNRDWLGISRFFTIEEGMEISERLFSGPKKPDAVFCASGDMTAVGVIEGAKKHGMKVPQDISVVGFDDFDYTAYLNTPLTTIKQNFTGIGAAAFDAAAGAMEGKTGPFKHVLIEPELVVRKSA